MDRTKLEGMVVGALADGGPLRRLAREFGRASTGRREDTLRVLRLSLAARAAEDPFARGYRAARADVSAAVEAEVRHEDEAHAAQKLGRREQHRRVLDALRDGRRVAADLVAQVNLDKSQLSRSSGSTSWWWSARRRRKATAARTGSSCAGGT
jgi:hypothetical protein